MGPKKLSFIFCEKFIIGHALSGLGIYQASFGPANTRWTCISNSTLDEPDANRNGLCNAFEG